MVFCVAWSIASGVTETVVFRFVDTPAVPVVMVMAATAALPPSPQRMRRFKSVAHLQRFASVHGVVQNFYRIGRHLHRAVHYRQLRTRSLGIWNEVTCAC
jgi:hypothetical protein